MTTSERPRGGDATRPQTFAPVEKHLLAAVAAELEGEMRRRWAAYYPERRGGGEPVITFMPRQCGFSAIFKVDFDFPGSGRESVIVKIRRQQKHGSFLRGDLSERTVAMSRAEFDEHVKAARFFEGNEAGLGVVRPLDFIESHNAIVVAFAAGRDLSKVVNEGDALAAPSVRRCGEWWRRFHHELHRAEMRPWQPDALEASFERRFQRLRTIGAPAEVLEPLQEEIRATAMKLPPVPVPVSLVHGDCKLRHVWATAQGIQVLDFGNAKVGDSWIDPAALVVELSLYSLWTPRIDASLKAEDIRTLLHAYFGGPPPQAFALYVVDCLLKKWHRRLRKWGPGSGITRLRKSLQAAGLDKPLERLYIDRWFTTQVRAWLQLGEGRPPAWLRTIVQ